MNFSIIIFSPWKETTFLLALYYKLSNSEVYRRLNLHLPNSKKGLFKVSRAYWKVYQSLLKGRRWKRHLVSIPFFEMEINELPFNNITLSQRTNEKYDNVSCKILQEWRNIHSDNSKTRRAYRQQQPFQNLTST